jgi:hypothetical protein
MAKGYETPAASVLALKSVAGGVDASDEARAMSDAIMRGPSVGLVYSADDIKREMAQAAAPRGEKAVNKVSKPAARSGARRGTHPDNTMLLDTEEDEHRVEIYEEALYKIVHSADAYPLDVFPEPDFDRARGLLEAGGITLDAVYADAMRRATVGAGAIAREALVRGLKTRETCGPPGDGERADE